MGNLSENLSPFAVHKDGCLISIRLTPKASRNRVLGVEEEFVKIAVTAVPEDGKANLALTRFLAELLGIGSTSVVLVSGSTSRLKKVLVEGKSPEEVRKLIA